jgi:hypothetical protein
MPVRSYYHHRYAHLLCSGGRLSSTFWRRKRTTKNDSAYKFQSRYLWTLATRRTITAQACYLNFKLRYTCVGVALKRQKPFLSLPRRNRVIESVVLLNYYKNIVLRNYFDCQSHRDARKRRFRPILQKDIVTIMAGMDYRVNSTKESCPHLWKVHRGIGDVDHLVPRPRKRIGKRVG